MVKKRGLLCRCVDLDDWLTQTASLVFGRARQCQGSAGTPKPAAWGLSDLEKNAVRGVWSLGTRLLRSHSAPDAGSVVWRHAGLLGARDGARVVAALGRGEARETARAGRHPF